MRSAEELEALLWGETNRVDSGVARGFVARGSYFG